ncbi:DUF4255 domain-containing protein [Paenibacillus campi]|uniref:DUF4255 domain-containing protein n=1 Tax=Paenibacillus campi TaxID=3106031 RepID=UPI002AFF074D|nr:DUF4255 domain-containing protein [Paenibacillus sp. SGZ-1009]
MTIVGLLRQQLVPDTIAHAESIGLASPLEEGELAVSVYLFDIRQSRDYQMNEMIVQNRGTLRYPPLCLELYYLITVHSRADLPVRALDSNRIMGGVLQTLHDYASVGGAELVGTLKENNEELRLILDDLPSERLSQIFSQKPYRLSVACRAGPVMLESLRTKKVSRVLDANLAAEHRNGDGV